MGMPFYKIFEYVDKITLTGDLLEIGSDNGEGSTAILGNIAKYTGKKLYSVDMNSAIINSNKEKYTSIPVQFYCQTGEEFLDEHPNLKLSVVLLDNFDWNWHPNNPPDFIQQAISNYKESYGLDMTNVNSQKVHLLQAIRLTSMLCDEAIIICDDTYWLSDRAVYCGKCGSAIPYLISIGFEPINDSSGTGVVLIRKKI